MTMIRVFTRRQVLGDSRRQQDEQRKYSHSEPIVFVQSQARDTEELKIMVTGASTSRVHAPRIHVLKRSVRIKVERVE